MDMPFQTVEDSDEGIGEDVIVVDEFAIGTAGAIGDAPAEVFGRAGKDLADATAILEADFIGGGGVNKPTSLDDGEEAPADLGFFLGGEFDGDNAGWEGIVEQRPEAFAHTGGVDNDVLWRPLLRQVLDLAEDGEVILAGPGLTGEDAVGRSSESGDGGEVDANDGESGGIATWVAEAFAEEGGGKAGVGFVHAGDVDEKPHPVPPQICRTIWRGRIWTFGAS